MVLDNTYLEEVIFGLFQIDVVSLISNKVNLAKNFHIQPSEIDKMCMWEYELFMQELNEVIKKENKEQKSEMDKYHLNDVHKMTDPKRLGSMTPKMPNMGSIKIPKI